jgi:hypothetical protein
MLSRGKYRPLVSHYAEVTSEPTQILSNLLGDIEIQSKYLTIYTPLESVFLMLCVCTVLQRRLTTVSHRLPSFIYLLALT